MAIFDEYREGVRETLREFSDASRFQKLGLAIITIGGIYADKRLLEESSLCIVEDPVVLRDKQWEPAELEKELKELLNES